MKNLVSIVVPCYNEESALKIFYEEIVKVSKKLSAAAFEFVFVDDGSNDRTLEEIEKLHKRCLLYTSDAADD